MYVCVCAVHIYRHIYRERETERHRRERERETGKIYFKKSAHAIVGAGKSKISRAVQQAGNSDRYLLQSLGKIIFPRNLSFGS